MAAAKTAPAPAADAPAPAAAGSPPISALADEYKETFSKAAEGLRQRAQTLQTINPQEEVDKLRAQYEPQAEAYKQAVTNMDPAEVPVDAFARFYSWVSICLFGGALSAFFAAPFVSPFLSVAGVSSALAIWLAALGVPYLTLNYFNNGDKMTSFYGSLMSGLLLGHGLGHCYYVNWTPPVFLLPALITLVLSFGGAQLSSNRGTLVGAAVGAPAAVVLVFGLLLGSLDFTYLLFTLAFAIVFAVNIQLRLADKSPDFDRDVAWLLGVCTLVTAVLTLLTSMTKEAAQEAYAAQQQSQ